MGKDQGTGGVIRGHGGCLGGVASKNQADPAKPAQARVQGPSSSQTEKKKKAVSKTPSG